MTEIKAKSTRTNILKADVYNTSGIKSGKVTLPVEFFGAKVNPNLLSQSVRVYLTNQRSGTRKVKTRHEIAHSGRKIYRQKGTGRARHGDIKAPIFIGGGIAHGPKPKDYRLHLTKKMRQKSLAGALTYKYNSASIKFITNFDKFPPKTKKMVEFLQALKLADKADKAYSLLLVTKKTTPSVLLSSRNFPYLSVTPVNQLNTYQVLRNKFLLMEKDAVESLLTKPETKK